jgi:hypothetical protein
MTGAHLDLAVGDSALPEPTPPRRTHPAPARRVDRVLQLLARPVPSQRAIDPLHPPPQSLLPLREASEYTVAVDRCETMLGTTLASAGSGAPVHETNTTPGSSEALGPKHNQVVERGLAAERVKRADTQQSRSEHDVWLDMTDTAK